MMDLNQSVLLNTVHQFDRVMDLEGYEGMLGSLTEDDPKVRQFISDQAPRFIVEFYRLDIDNGQSNLRIQEQGKRPVVTIRRNAETIVLPIPERRTPPVCWQYKKIGERNMFDLGSLLMCDVVRIGRFPFNHFYPVMRNGDLDLTVSREHALVLFYKGGLHYIDYGSLVKDDSARKEGSTNGTFLQNGEKIHNCMYEWAEGEPLELGQSLQVIVGRDEVKKRMFKVVYKKFAKTKSDTMCKNEEVSV